MKSKFFIFGEEGVFLLFVCLFFIFYLFIFMIGELKMLGMRLLYISVSETRRLLSLILMSNNS
jgi:hypothetical protein